MDKSRESDLRLLSERFNDPFKTLATRKRAYRSFLAIKAQMGDRHLTEQRQRLIKAIQHNDAYLADKIERQIKDYERQQWWFRPTTTG